MRFSKTTNYQFFIGQKHSNPFIKSPFGVFAIQFSTTKTHFAGIKNHFLIDKNRFVEATN